MKRLYESDLEIAAGERDVRDRPDNPNRHERPRTREQLIVAAINELREADFSPYDFRVLERVRDRLSGEEREVMDRALAVIEPRKLP